MPIYMKINAYLNIIWNWSFKIKYFFAENYATAKYYESKALVTDEIVTDVQSDVEKLKSRQRRQKQPSTSAEEDDLENVGPVKKRSNYSFKQCPDLPAPEDSFTMTSMLSCFYITRILIFWN